MQTSADAGKGRQQTPMWGEDYRPDIDGLRAIAILAVVGFHIGIPGMSGGFVGVDIFFVLSGYLITGLLAREYRTSSSIDFAGFLARRVRRLLPALAVLILGTLLIGFLLLLPNEQAELGKTGIASAILVTNVYYWAVGQSYFAATNYPPFQHLWTLALEAQFYIAWPILILLAAKIAQSFGRRTDIGMAVLFAILSLTSLASAVWLSAGHPVFSYLLPVTRTWEYGAGSLLALTRVPTPAFRRLLAPMGLLAVIIAVIVFDETVPYPSFYGCLPVFGTIALIAAGRESQSDPIVRLIASPPMRVLGKLSYSWYLWHWPLLAIARSVWGADGAMLRDVALAAAALLLAALSYRFVERPVLERRAAMFATRRRTLTSGALLMLACGLVSTTLWLWAWRPLPPGSLLAQYRLNRGEAERDFPFCDEDLKAHCTFDTDNSAATILVWGDSHAAHLSKGLERAASTAHVNILMRTMGGCSPAGPSAATDSQRGPAFQAECNAFNARTLEAIASLSRGSGFHGVVIAGGWEPDRIDGLTGLKDHVDRLQSMGLRVILAGDVPLMPPDFLNCAIRHGPDLCALPLARVEGDEAPARAALATVAAGRPGVAIWSPIASLCPHRRCPAAIDGRLLYRNRNHLTVEGSARLAAAMVPMLQWLAGRTVMRSASPQTHDATVHR